MIVNLVREMELEMAANHPLFSGTPMRMADPSDLYPNVYDSLVKARLTSAYLEGKTVRQIMYARSHVTFTSVESMPHARPNFFMTLCY